MGPEEARLAVGQQAVVGGLQVRLVALSGQDVRFEVRSADAGYLESQNNQLMTAVSFLPLRAIP